jgi:hypothetical protein
MSNSIGIEGIVKGYSSIDRVHSIERERESTMSTKEFQEWCSTMNIGSRVHRVDSRASELMIQYTNYAKWLSKI